MKFIIVAILMTSLLSCGYDKTEHHVISEINVASTDEYDHYVIQKINDVAINGVIDDNEKTKRLLLDLVPEANRMNDKNEKYKALLQIYALTDVHKAIDFIDEVLRGNPDHWLLIYKCQLMKINDYDNDKVTNCFSHIAKKAKEEIKKNNYNKKDNPKEILSYYLAEINAGNVAYIQKSKDLLDEIPDPKKKDELYQIFNSQIDIEN
ncbi:hypothetical protein IM753_05655 [Moraxella sp. K127]|uniref:hypothetical protein n=1 Tax=Moraxella sp. K127 TaxID=2780079 RepID=UPI0018823187|nr:hypothetical protein [Moraxella sp. K127]MBE9590473.1 hypothetical protein [Moraxella sp. K127]